MCIRKVVHNPDTGVVSCIGTLGKLVTKNGPVDSSSVTVGSQSIPMEGNGDFDLVVSSTTGAPPIGYISVPNDSSGVCVISYNGTNATSFLNCHTYFHGAGNGYTLPSGSAVTISNTPVVLQSQFAGSATNTTSNDGRVWLMDSFQNLFYKSCPNKTYPDITSCNWAGPFLVQQAYASSKIPNESTPVRNMFNTLCQDIIYDPKLKALYVVVMSQPSYASPNDYLNLVISRDNGQTWSDPIRLRTLPVGNITMQNTNFDPVTGDFIISWYDGRVDPVNFLYLQRYFTIVTHAELAGYIADIPYFNPKYIVPPATTPAIGGQPGSFGTLIPM